MRRQTVHHAISIVLAIPLLFLALPEVIRDPGSLNPWNDSVLGEFWVVMWLMLLAGAIIPVNGILALLAMHRARSRQRPVSSVSPEAGQGPLEQPTTSANKCTHADREIAPLVPSSAIPGA